MSEQTKPAIADTPLAVSLVRLVRGRAVEPADLRDAERFVRDWLGSMVAGQATEPGRALLAYGKGLKDLEARVFLAAALSHITEIDDLHRGSTTHPGCVVVPTALVLGRDVGARGRAILTAVLAGYEVMLRVGEALGPAHYEVFHNTATAGVFGSAAAAASLLGLDEQQWVWALGNAGTQASGLWQFNEDATMSKHLHAGHAASAGVKAALLARVGFTGPSAILEGKRGFFRGFCPDAEPDAVLRPAAGWKLRETSIKPYPSCRHTHPAIDAALDLRARLGARTIGEGDALSIATYPAGARLCDNPDPTSPYAAKFSLQFCVSTTLLNGRPGLAAFDGSALREPVVRGLTGRAEVRIEPGLAEAYPVRWGSIVELSTADGARHVVAKDTASGDPEDALSDEAIDDKVRDLLAFGGLTTGESRDLVSASAALVEDGPGFGLPGMA